MSSQDDLEAAHDAFYRAFRDRDVEAMEALWAKRFPVSCIHPGWDVVSGREDVLESWRRILANPSSPPVVPTRVRVQLQDEMAVVTCHEGLEGRAPQLVATNVFVREDGEWKMVCHHAGPFAGPQARRRSTPPASELN